MQLIRKAFVGGLIFLNLELALAQNYPESEVNIVGGGIAGFFEAYFAMLDAETTQKTAKVTIYEKNPNISTTTTTQIAPSLTFDEIISVIPRGADLDKALSMPFFHGKGIRVDDVQGVNSSVSALRFLSAAKEYSKDDDGHRIRTSVLLELGKKSMKMWQELYEQGDEKLKMILEQSNFMPCKELTDPQNFKLGEGYRIDIMFNDDNAMNKAISMQDDYIKLGFPSTRILNPDEVIKIDNQLTSFVLSNSTGDEGQRKWKDNAAAVWRPGGCINVAKFLPLFAHYIEERMGTYVNKDGKEKHRFKIKFNSKVSGVIYNEKNQIENLIVEGNELKKTNNKHQYKNSSFVFAPGEAVKTLEELGFAVPAYAGFAGPSLRLKIKLSPEQLKQYENFKHCMEVHQDGVVLAWQVNVDPETGECYIAVAGTKAFYGDKSPQIKEAFAQNRHLLQLNIINGVLPELVSAAIGRNTINEKLTHVDLKQLVDEGIATPWVGTRAVAFDGFPTVGRLYNKNGDVNNARVTHHLGSGGCSFALGAVDASRKVDTESKDSLDEAVLEFGKSTR